MITNFKFVLVSTIHCSVISYCFLNIVPFYRQKDFKNCFCDFQRKKAASHKIECSNNKIDVPLISYI